MTGYHEVSSFSSFSSSSSSVFALPLKSKRPQQHITRLALENICEKDATIIAPPPPPTDPPIIVSICIIIEMGLFRTSIILIVLLLAAIYGITYAHQNGGEGVKKPEQVKKETYDVIIDVRPRKEYQVSHHSEAINIPLSKLRTKVPKRIKDTKKSILVYAQTGSRARIGAERLRSLGYTNVFYLVGDFEDIE